MADDGLNALIEVTERGVGVDGVRVPGVLLDEVKVAGPTDSGLWMTTVTILSSTRPAVDVGAELVRHDGPHEVIDGGAGLPTRVESVPATTVYRSRRRHGPDDRP